MDAVHSTEPQRRIAAVAAVAVMLVGVAVCATWVFGIPDATRLVPESSTVRFNTGLCLVLGGTGLLLTLGRNPPWALAAVVPIVLLAGLTLLEYLFDWNMAIDDIFVAGRTLPYSGRMAPNTAVGMMLAALGLAWWVVRRSGR